MIYTLTDKLNFDENPKIKIKDKTIEVKADAETVLSILDIIKSSDEIEAAIKSADLLFSDKDLKTIKSLKLGFKDYTTVLATAINLALGEDPDKEENELGEE